MFWLIATTSVIIGGAWIITRRLPLAAQLDRMLATGLVALTAQVAILLVAGVLLRQLNRITVVALSIAWLLGTWFLVRGPERVIENRIQFDDRSSRWSTLLLGAVMVTCVVALVVIASACWYLPPFAWDEIWYHLTPMAAWYQQEAIQPLPEAALWQGYDPAAVEPNQLAQDFSHAYTWANVYPLNAELSALWSMVLARSDLLSEASQFPYVLLGVLSTIGLGRMAGVGSQGAIVTGLLFLLTPTVLIHLRVAYVDAAFASMVAASLYLLLAWQKHASRGYAMLLGLAVGLMAGIKSTGLAFAFVYLAAALGYGIWQVHKGRMRSKELLSQALIAGLAALGTGSFWYLRTWWYYGNPIYPVQVKLLGFTLPGLGSVSELFMLHNTPPEYVGRNAIANLIVSWLELGSESYNYYSRTRGLGPVWGALALPAILPFTLAAYRARRTQVMWMLGVTSVLLLIQPAAWWPRYVLYVVPVGFVAMAWLFERLPSWGQGAASTLLLLNLLISTPLVLIETVDKLPAAMVMEREQRTFGQLYFDDYAWVDRLSPSRIGHTPMAWIYPLYGGLRHQVELVDGATMEAWRQAIVTSGVEYMAVNTRFGEYLHWADQLTDLLEPYMEGDQLNVYRVRR